MKFPDSLPVVRGLHICTPNFVKKFKDAFKFSSDEISGILDEKKASPMADPSTLTLLKSVFHNEFMYPS